MTKTQKIIENNVYETFQIIPNTDFKDEKLEQYIDFTKNLNIELDSEANTINYYGMNESDGSYSLLFKIKINNKKK
jgi:hypothetical protein